MGDLIVLAERRSERSRATATRPLPALDSRIAFYFDLGCPFSYLTAERIERVLGDVQWIPAAGSALRGKGWAQQPSVRAHAETCAVALRLPLVWPEQLATAASGALRAAAYAAEIGAGARFALAASRLAFCGGFDIEDPEILAEAAAAAGVPLRECLIAAGDPARDVQLRAVASQVQAHGVDRLPAICIGQRWVQGEQALAEAAALLRTRTAPLAPAG